MPTPLFQLFWHQHGVIHFKSIFVWNSQRVHQIRNACGLEKFNLSTFFMKTVLQLTERFGNNLPTKNITRVI